MTRRIVLSGCSGGGKSTLLSELARRGHEAVAEPGRAIVAEERARGGTALPWVDAAAFMTRVLARSLADHAAARGPVAVFDRCAVDALAWFERTGTPLPADLSNAAARLRYDRDVILVPPWPEIYRTDAERRHGFDAAVAEYRHLRDAFPARGYRIHVLPRGPVAERADEVERILGL